MPHSSIPDSEYPWIGIKDVGNNDVFVWVSGAEVEAGYTNWDDGSWRLIWFLSKDGSYPTRFENIQCHLY